MKNKRKPEEQRRHDEYVAKLTLLTDKPLAELTLDEFRWLAGRFFIPLGETPQSRCRREFVGSLVSEESAGCYARFSEEEAKGTKLPSILDFVDAAYTKALANRTTWPS